MRKSPDSQDRHSPGPGGEGGSVFRNFLGAPTHLTDALTPSALLTISVLLSVILVGLTATALTR